MKKSYQARYNQFADFFGYNRPSKKEDDDIKPQDKQKLVEKTFSHHLKFDPMDTEKWSEVTTAISKITSKFFVDTAKNMIHFMTYPEAEMAKNGLKGLGIKAEYVNTQESVQIPEDITLGTGPARPLSSVLPRPYYYGSPPNQLSSGIELGDDVALGISPHIKLGKLLGITGFHNGIVFTEDNRFEEYPRDSLTIFDPTATPKEPESD